MCWKKVAKFIPIFPSYWLTREIVVGNEARGNTARPERDSPYILQSNFFATVLVTAVRESEQMIKTNLLPFQPDHVSLLNIISH